MPKVARRRTVAAPPERLWDLVADPHHRPRWWPGVERVEEAHPEAWTEVLRTPRGKVVRADFTRVSAERPRRLRWQQEVEASPFERFLRESVTEVALERAGAGETQVELRAVQRLRGLARLGAPIVRWATARRLDEALEGLDRIAGERAPA